MVSLITLFFGAARVASSAECGATIGIGLRAVGTGSSLAWAISAAL